MASAPARFRRIRRSNLSPWPVPLPGCSDALPPRPTVYLGPGRRPTTKTYLSRLLSSDRGSVRSSSGAASLRARSRRLKKCSGSRPSIIPQFVALAQMYKGSALCALSNNSQGLALVRQGLEGNFALGRRLALPELLTWLAEAQMRAGVLHDATSTLDDALNAAPAELYWRPETLRLRGEVTLMRKRSR